MKILFIILITTLSLSAQDKIQVLVGVSYAPSMEVLKVNKYSLIPSFSAIIGDDKTALLLVVGNVSKIGVVARKGIFRAGINYAIDLFHNEGPKHMAELEAGVLFQIGNSTNLGITMSIAATIEESNSFYTPLNIGIYKNLIQ